MVTLLAISLMCCFASLEVGQIVSDGFGYLTDPWNCIDLSSISMNSFFLFMALYKFFIDSETDPYFDIFFVRGIGSFSCFLMWIKVFYWMRLFSSLAYYVKLIMQTISDCIPFMVMVLIICLAFANYFYIADLNLKYSGTDGNYYNDYFDNSVVDILISMYMLGALGDFDSTRYKVGPDGDRASMMFLMATFIICVVFMNMLIAIMGETFG